MSYHLLRLPKILNRENLITFIYWKIRKYKLVTFQLSYYFNRWVQNSWWSTCVSVSVSTKCSSKLFRHCDVPLIISLINNLYYSWIWSFFISSTRYLRYLILFIIIIKKSLKVIKNWDFLIFIHFTAKWVETQ